MPTKLVFVLFCLVVLFVATSLAQNCPHTQSGLTDFYTKFGQVVNGSELTVAAGESILLSSFPGNVVLKSITINGRLILSDANFNLNVNWIRVNNGGFLIAGSAT